MKIHNTKDLLFLIQAIKQTDPYIVDIFLNGGCYQFHLMLKKFIQDCDIRINKEKDHVVTYFKRKYFDITGEVTGQFEVLTQFDWDRISNWSFAKNKALLIKECPVCEEPIVV